MGNGTFGGVQESNTVTIEPVTDSGKSGNRRVDTDNKSTSTTGTNTGTGGSGGTGGTGGTTSTENKPAQEIDGFHLLTDEEKQKYLTADKDEQKRLIRNAKKRQRYAEKKENGGQTVKPRKVKSQTKNEPKPAIDVTQLNLIVMGLSSAVASRPNCEHWLLTEPEINSITVPLSKMLAESQMFANMGQYSNQIALCMACITVFAPRLIVTVQKQKEAKKLARTGQHTDTVVHDDKVGTTGKTKDSNSKPNRGNDKKSTIDGTNSPDNVPFYGVPIC